MMLEKLAENNVLINLAWSYVPETHEAYHLEWVTHLKRTHRRLNFLVDDGQSQTGYCSKMSTLFEPFALWIKQLYSDGIYFCEDKGFIYFLIISGGSPVSGSDRLVTPRFWVNLREQLKVDARYKHLVLKEITHEHISTVIERCVENQSRLKKRRQMIISALALGGFLFLILFVALLKFFLRG